MSDELTPLESNALKWVLLCQYIDGADRTKDQIASMIDTLRHA